MSRREKKKIADFLNQPTPEARQVEEAVKRIHQKQPGEKMVRVSVDTPEGLHRQLKKLMIDEGTDLKTFFLEAVAEKMERLDEERLK
jgi:hypothetical protein